MLMSCGVIIAAVVIYFEPSLWWFDPVCTYLFALLVLCTSYPVLKNCLVVIMEGTPDSINTTQLEKDILKLDGIVDVHDLHVWQISQGKFCMMVHIKSHNALKTLAEVTDLCRRQYQLFHTTI